MILTFETLRTRILFAWNIAVITKPAVENRNFDGKNVPNTFYIKMGSEASIPNTLSKINEKTMNFLIDIVGASKEDSNNYLSELERIIDYYDDGSGWWKFGTATEDDTTKIFIYNCSGYKRALD